MATEQIKIRSIIKGLNDSGLLAKKVNAIGKTNVVLEETAVQLIEDIVQVNKEGELPRDVMKFYKSKTGKGKDGKPTVDSDCDAFKKGWSATAEACKDCFSFYSEEWEACKKAVKASKSNGEDKDPEPDTEPDTEPDKKPVKKEAKAKKETGKKAKAKPDTKAKAGKKETKKAKTETKKAGKKVGKKETKKADKKKAETGKKEKKPAYVSTRQMYRNMVEEGKDEKAITKALTKAYNDKGITDEKVISRNIYKIKWHAKRVKVA